VAVFDLDGTLTWRDTLVSYLIGYILRHPARLTRLWRIIPAVAGFFTSGHDRGLLKSRLIRAAMGGDPRSWIDAWSDRFVASLPVRHRFRPAALAVLDAHRAAGDHLVLLSASPDLYVPRIGKLLGFDETLCTEIAWRTGTDPDSPLEGTLQTPNRRGEEKSRCVAWLRTRYPGMPVIAYGNSRSDLPHLAQSDRAMLVNGSPAARRAAAASGIAVADWT